MVNEKILIFDSGSLINFTMNGLSYLLPELKKLFGGRFIITKEVKYEVVDKPSQIKKFQLAALKLKELYDIKVLELPNTIPGINIPQLDKLSKKILNLANSTFYSDSKRINLIHKGEASCLALSELLNEKKIKNAIVIDERTTRMLGESPEKLRKILEKKLEIKIKINEVNYNIFKDITFIRSAELYYIAYKKELIKLKNGNVLEALLYASKYKGCAISFDEINEIKKL